MDDILITNATVVTVDSANRILRDAAIAICGRAIVAIGPTQVVSFEHPARQVIDARGMVVMPGLVNGHIHMLTALYKGTMCGFGFDRTMGEDIDFCGRATPDIMLAASRLSAVEMLRSGITLANVDRTYPCVSALADRYVQLATARPLPAWTLESWWAVERAIDCCPLSCSHTR